MRTRPKYLWGLRHVGGQWQVAAAGSLYRFGTFTEAFEAAKEFGADLELPSGRVIQTATATVVEIAPSRREE